MAGKILSFCLTVFILVFTKVMADKDDREKKCAEQREKERRRKIERDFRERCLDEELEVLLKERLDDPREAMAIYTELKEIFDQVPHCEDMLNAWRRYGKKSVEYQMALRLLMAKRGKIPYSEKPFFSYNSYCGVRMHLPPQTPASERLKRKRFKQLMLWTEKELQRHGLPVKLITVVKRRDNPSGTYSYLAERYQDPTENGKLLDNICGYSWSACCEALPKI